MKALFTAIKAKWDTDPPDDLSLYLYEAPQSAQAPYAVYMLISNVADWTFTEGIESVRIRFSIYSASRSAVEVTEAMDALQTLFDDCTLSVTGYGHLYMQRDTAVMFKDEGTWAYHVDYNIMIQK
jgi:hypothetical protein